MSEEKFDEEKFMKVLVKLKDTQESIQGFSSWCIKNRKQSYKMARCWSKVIKKVKIDQKLVLFYLVNDVVQHSAKKGIADILDKFRSSIKDALPHLKEEKIANKVQRCLNIWKERNVYDTEFIEELLSLIDMTPAKEDSEIIENFQSNELCKQIKIMKALEDDADYKLKTLKENDLENKDLEMMKAKLKDKSSGYSHVGQFRETTKQMEAYMTAMKREVNKRKQVIELLCQGRKYYDSLYGEAEIVAQAYANFGNRVSNVESRLKDKIPIFLSNPSPLPSPDYDAPSPQGEADLKLPEEDEPGTPDYPPPSLTPPGPPPNVRTSSHAHTPPGHYPHSATPPPPPDDYKHPRHNSYTPPHRAYTPPHAAGRSFTPPSPPPPPVSAVGTRRSYSPPSPKHTDLTSRISSFFHHSQSQDSRDLTREAMNIPRENVNDFLTKIAHGEVIGSHDSFFSSMASGDSSDSKRRKLSDSGSYTGGSGPVSADTGYGSQLSWPPTSTYQNGVSSSVAAGVSSATSGTAVSSWQEEPVPDWLQTEESDGDDIVENQALERLRRAANKIQGSSNLISLTGSPAVRDPGVDNEIDGNPMHGDDMEMSSEEDGEIVDDVAQNPWAQHQNPPVSSSALYASTQPPPPSILSNGNGGIHTYHHQPPPIGLAGTVGSLPVLDIPPPPFRVPPPIDKSADESGSKPWTTTSVMDVFAPSTSNTFNVPPPIKPMVSEPTTFNNPPPIAASFSAPPPTMISRPPPPLSPTPPAAVVSNPPPLTSPQVSTPSNIPPPGFNQMRRLSSESAASSENFSLSSGGGQSFDKKPPSFGGNDYENDNGGEDYDNDYDEHLNNIRSCDPEALDYDTNNSSFDGGNGMTPTKPPFRGGGGMRGRGNFTPDRGGFKPDHHRGGGEGFGNRGTPRGRGGFRGGNFERGDGGGNFERGGGRGNGNWKGEQRGGGNWRPRARRPWGGPSPSRGRGNW